MTASELPEKPQKPVTKVAPDPRMWVFAAHTAAISFCFALISWNIWPRGVSVQHAIGWALAISTALGTLNYFIYRKLPEGKLWGTCNVVFLGMLELAKPVSKRYFDGSFVAQLVWTLGSALLFAIITFSIMRKIMKGGPA